MEILSAALIVSLLGMGAVFAALASISISILCINFFCPASVVTPITDDVEERRRVAAIYGALTFYLKNKRQ
ncbi:MAG: hypothetical protein ACN4E2_07145 [Nitrospinota bacterium]